MLIFKRLITDTNELGKVRPQFYVVTDSHDQMRSAIEVCKYTCKLYAHNLLNHIFTDNPYWDKGFFHEIFDSLVDYSNISASNVFNNISTSIQNEILLIVELHEDQITFTFTNQGINSFYNALRDQLSEEEPINKAMGLNCEWDIHINTSRDNIGTSKICITQISYRNQ